MTTAKLNSTVSNILANGIVQRVASNFGWSIVSEAVGRALFFTTNIYLARALGVSNFGLFTLAQAITLYFWLAVDLGTNMYGIREIAKHKERAEVIISPLLTLRITAGLIVFSLYVISLLLIEMTVAKKFIFAAAGLYLITYSFYTDWVLKGLEKFKYIVFGNLISAIVFFACVILFVRGSENVFIASIVWALSYLSGSFLLLTFIFRKLGIKYRPSFNYKLWLFHLKESIHFTLSGSLMALYRYLPILLIGLYFNNYEIGLFSASYRIVIAACSAGFLLPMSIYPVFSELYHEDRLKFHHAYGKFQKVMMMLGLMLAIPGAIFSNEIIKLLLGSQYLTSVAVFKILIWLVPLYFFRFSFGTVLLATGFQRHHNLATVIGVLCLLAVGLILIPRASAVGGAWALIAAEILMIGSMALVSQFTFRKKDENVRVSKQGDFRTVGNVTFKI